MLSSIGFGWDSVAGHSKQKDWNNNHNNNNHNNNQNNNNNNYQKVDKVREKRSGSDGDGEGMWMRMQMGRKKLLCDTKMWYWILGTYNAEEKKPYAALDCCSRTGLTGPSVGVSVYTRVRLQARGVVVHEAPLPAIRMLFVAFAVTGDVAHVSVTRAVLQCTWSTRMNSVQMIT